MPVTTVDSITIPSGVAPTPSTTYFTTVTEAMYAWGNSMPEYIFAKYPGDVHLYIPGADGVAVNTFPTNNYTLSDGSSGYSAVDGTAGLVLDAAGSVGAELVTNGDFSQGTTGWTIIQTGWSISGGAASVNSAAAGSTFLRQGTTVADAWYMVTFDVTSYTSGSLYPIVGSALSPTAITSAGTGFVRFVKAIDTTGFGVYAQSTTTVATIDNISVKQVTGIHATQSTTANKPALRRGLYNLLTQSNDFTGWGKTGAPVVTASTVTRTVTGPTYVQGPAVTKAATAMPYSLIGKFTAGTGRYVAMRAQSIYPNFADAVFDLQNGTVYSSATNGSFTGQIASIVKAANGECTCCVSFTTDAGTAVYGFASPNSNGVAIDGTDSSATSSFSSGGMAVAQGVWTAQGVLNEGGIPLTTSTAASNSGAGRYWHQYGGGSQSLPIGSVPYQMSDDHCVIVGWRADVFQNNIVAPSYTSNTARYGSIGTSSGGNGIITEWYDGTQYVNHQTVVAKGSVNVTSATKASGLVKSRNNGVSFGSGAAFSTAVQGTVAAISPTGALGTFTGAIGPVILIKGTISDSDLLTLERWVASLTPAAPTF